MSVGLIGNQIEDPVEALDKDKSGERALMYVFVIVCEMGSNDDEKSITVDKKHYYKKIRINNFY